MRIKKPFLITLLTIKASIACFLAMDVLAQNKFPQERLDVKHFYIEGDGFDINSDKDIQIKTLLKKANDMKASLGQNVTIDELYQIADRLTIFVRNKGYRFDQIYLPQQRIYDGIVRLRYKKAFLTDINIINRSTIEDKVIQAPFKSFLNSPLFVPRIDEKVYALRAQTGIKVFAYFSRAGRKGEVRLNLKVEDLPRFAYAIYADNFGSSATGTYRIHGEVGLTRLFSTFDSVNVVATQSLDNLDTRFGQFAYSYPFASMNTSINFSIGNGNFAIGNEFASLDIDGSTFSTNLEVQHKLKHKRDNESWLSAGLYQRQSDTKSGFDDSLNNDEVSQAAMLSFGWNKIFQSAQTRLRTLIYFSGGQFEGNQFEDSNTLTKLGLNFSSSSLFFSDRQFAPQLSIGLRGQYTGALMPAIETLVLGGNYAVRAYPAGRLAADNAIITNTNLYFPFAFRNINSNDLSLIPYAFYDYAKGEKYNLNQSGQTFSAQGMGLGLRVRFYQVSTSLAWAKPIAVNNLSSDIDDQQWLFELRWH